MLRIIEATALAAKEVDFCNRETLPPPADPEAETKAATNAVTDIIHCCALRGLDWQQVLKRAEEGFREEALIGAELDAAHPCS